jgi:hypothetical protein
MTPRSKFNAVAVGAVLLVGMILVLFLRYREHRGQIDPASAPLEKSGSAQGMPSQQPSPGGSAAGRSGGKTAHFRAAFLTPITFYGRVLDQNNQPIAGASVKLAANDKPLLSPSEYHRTTDSGGLFSISGIVGLTLLVEVSKPGYRIVPADEPPPTSSGVFEFGLGTHPHQPDKKRPVVFRLLRIGNLEPLVKVGRQTFPVSVDGSQAVISLDSHGGHAVVLHCWSSEGTRPPGQRQYDWRMEVAVQNGGIVRRNGGFEAPEQGYLVQEVIDMPASLPRGRWDTAAQRSYFVHFDDNTFARVDFDMRVEGEFVDWESFFNPQPGSRNLESAPGQ